MQNDKVLQKKRMGKEITKMFGIVDTLGAFRTIGIIQVAETQDEGGILVKDFLPNQYKCIEAHLKALEIVRKAFHSSSIYTNKLRDSLECGWITQEEYDLLQEVLLCQK